MLKRISLPALLLSLVATAGLARAEGDQWLVDFDKAKAQAKKEGKSILMDFTGSDWCGYCIQLDKKVFSQEVFQQEAPKHFVLLKLDYPRDKSKQTKEEIAQNAELRQKYGYAISGYPTILLTDAEGQPFAKKGGYDGTPAPEYVAELKEKAAIRKQLDDFFTKAEGAEGVDKATLLDKALSLVDAELVFNVYSDTVDQIAALDANNKAGLKSKYQAKVELAKLKTASGSPKEKLEKVNKLIAELDLKGEVLQEAMFIKAFQQYSTDDKEGAKTTLEAALKLAPESQVGQQIDSILKRVFK